MQIIREQKASRAIVRAHMPIKIPRYLYLKGGNEELDDHTRNVAILGRCEVRYEDGRIEELEYGTIKIAGASLKVVGSYETGYTAVTNLGKYRLPKSK